jgi:site-specific recombinase XerD
MWTLVIITLLTAQTGSGAGRDTRRIQDWLGHRSIQHTTRYTQLSAAPFKNFWR